jgi:hypothetical protein
MNLPLHYQFAAASVKAQISQMSPEQLVKFAGLLVDRVYDQEAFIQAVNQDYIKNNRPLPFVPLDPSQFNDPPQ